MHNERRMSGSEGGDAKPTAARRHGARRLLYTSPRTYDRAEHFIADVEVVVGEAAALVSDNPVVGVLGGIFRHGDAEGGSDLHAFENEVHAVGIVAHDAALPAADKILLAHALLGPF